jgi:hypothetical protein
MEVIIEKLGNESTLRTLVFNPETNNYFVVSTVDTKDFSETLIFRSDEFGSIGSYTEVWGTGAGVQHEDVIALLKEDTLTEEYFNMEEL